METIDKELLFELRAEFRKETGLSCNVNDGEYTDWLEQKAIKNHGSIGDVLNITERLDNMRVEIERLKEFTGLDHL